MEKLVPICRNNGSCRIYAGEKLCLPLVVVYTLKTAQKTCGWAYHQQKVGNAVQRNRSRRVIREAFRALAPRVRPGFDLVLVARGKTPYVKSTDVRRQLERQRQAAGLLREETAMKRALLWLIRFYRSAISPRKPAMCKYTPPAPSTVWRPIERFGAFKGGLLTLWLHFALQPLEPGRLRPVPEKKDKRKSLAKRGA